MITSIVHTKVFGKKKKKVTIKLLVIKYIYIYITNIIERVSFLLLGKMSVN